MNIILLLLPLLLVLLLPTSAFSEDVDHNSIKNEKPIKVGIFPRRNKKVTTKLFNPMFKYLENKLNRKVVLSIPKSFLEFWKALEKNEYHLVHYNQYHYLVSHKKMGYQVILRNDEFGSANISSTIVVRKDSGINSIVDLRGKSIVFGGGPRAMQSYIYARYLLEQELLFKGDYTQEFSVNPPNAIFTVFYGKADAAGVGDKILLLDMVTNQINTKKLKTISSGMQLPHLPWAVSASMSDKLRIKITKVLLTLKDSDEGRSILKSAQLDALVETQDSDYDEHRKIVKDVLGESY